MLKLHLVDLLSIRYTTNFATNTVTNRTDGAYALVYCSTSVDRRRWYKQWSVVVLTSTSSITISSFVWLRLCIPQGGGLHCRQTDKHTHRNNSHPYSGWACY